MILRPGRTPAAELETIDRGLYVTELMGFGFNAVTGDYSQGAGGFWIESGELAYPVTEITVSANFDELWKGIDAVGDDLDTRSSVQCPTFRVVEDDDRRQLSRRAPLATSRRSARAR